MRTFLFTFCVFSITFLACSGANQTEKQTTTAFDEPPEWSKEAIWYQIFVERFRNGDPTNDPRPIDIAGSYPGTVPENWQTTPWTHDWYAPDPYWDELQDVTDFFGNELASFGQKAQLRRYGGDLQGVLDKIDYLDSLGVTAIYFNPLNDAPSLHKFDARNWHHIDRNFGPDPEGDAKLMASENPADTDTWVWTSADKLFLDVIDELHQRDMKLILDFSWNHTGIEFWAWKDILEKQQQSEYTDWYFIDEFDDPNTAENEFSYRGWVGVYTLPEIKETYRVDHSDGIHIFDADIYSDQVKQHIFDVSERWLDPNGDGDPSDGVDGFRLDVAAEVGLTFWRDYREFVRSVNPDAYLLGELWWQQYPDDLLDPEPMLRGDVFDAPMNYRWYRATRHFFNQSPDKIPVSEYVDSLQSFQSNIREVNNYAMMNMTASHDTPRFGTSVYNKNKYMFQPKPDDNPKYKIDKPDASTYETMKLILTQQYTYIGAPQIWNGDEMGMWGANDPSTRKPLIWKDYEFEAETTHPLGFDRPINEVTFDDAWFQFMRQIIAMRKSNSVLSHGEIEYLIVDDECELLAYSRFDDEQEIITVFNAGNESTIVDVPTKFGSLYSALLYKTTFSQTNGMLSVELPARSAAILSSE
jgi:cyclomaltodextrinase